MHEIIKKILVQRQANIIQTECNFIFGIMIAFYVPNVLLHLKQSIQKIEKTIITFLKISFAANFFVVNLFYSLKIHNRFQMKYY